MLNVCTGNNSHDEIVHNGHICPLCQANAERDKAESERRDLEGERDKLLATVEKMLGR